MDLGGGVGDAWKYWRMSEEIVASLVRALWRCRMSRRGTLGRALLVLVVLLMWHLGWPLLLGEITECRDDQFVVAHERRGRFG
jgi:hypothetical protein